MVTPPCIIGLNRDFIVALRRRNVYTRLERRMEAAKIRYTGPADDGHAGPNEPVLRRHHGEPGGWTPLRRLVNRGKVIFVFPGRRTKNSDFQGDLK
jgi:hypothetical protein